MNPRLVPVLALLLACAPGAPASESLVHRGTGVRTKPILGAMYELALWVPESLREADAKAVIEADLPMEFVLTIKSGLINRKRYVEATTEGFAQAAASGYTTPRQPVFLAQFDATEFRKGDLIVMSYRPGGLVSTYRRQTAPGVFADTVLGTLPGLDLKQAVFAIWLGDAPVQKSLRDGLLGKK